MLLFNESHVENLDKFYKLHTQHDHVNINVTHTVSVWNFFYLREFHHYFETVYPEFLIWNNLVHFPEWCEANVVPSPEKEQIIDRVSNPEKYGLPAWEQTKYDKDIAPLVAHASTDSTIEHWHKFILQVKAGDIYRDESFENTFPELYNTVKEDMISI